MMIEDRIISLIKKIGIPIGIVFLAIGIMYVINSYYSMRLTILQIKELKKELGMDVINNNNTNKVQ